jgi:glycine/D-amino acid oxidase-like deaminating enzyme
MTDPGRRVRSTSLKDYGSYSLWLDQVSDELDPRLPLAGDTTADVAIVGGGYTGLWTAYYLLKAEPTLDVVIVERDIAGFGASGRNGGWCSALFAASYDNIAKHHGRSGVIAMQRAMFETVDEVGSACLTEGIDADFHKGGTLTLVTAPMQEQRVRAYIAEARAWGFGDEDYRWLDETETRARIRVEGAGPAVFTPHCARIHPAKLVRGLARVVAGLGARIYELTPAIDIEPGIVTTARGTITAGTVVRATEAYTVQLPGHRRTLVPLYSLMVATEPLAEDVWRAIGWDGYETLHDGRHLLIYAQRTADGRIAMGGRGAPYSFGSKIDDTFDRVDVVHAAIEATLKALFPQAADARITHRWGGPVGVPRDWFSSVGYDPSEGIAWAGGYVGDGVSTTNLAGRTLRDLLLERDTELTRLPWVNHRSRRWEPEPLRWAGINLGIRLMGSADRQEERTGRPTKRGEVVKKLIGL